jgi:hypothetical protein
VEAVRGVIVWPEYEIAESRLLSGLMIEALGIVEALG